MVAEKMKVKAEIVKEETISFPIRSSGRLSAKSEQKLSFRTGGIIKNIAVTEGQTVKKGQLLAELNLAEIQAQANMASQGYEKAKRDFTRAENLYNDSVATLELYQDAQTALQVAESQLEIAKFNLKYSRITAPDDGKILKILAEENEMTGSGYPVLLFGSVKNNWIIRTSISDRDVVAVKQGDPAHIYFDAYPNTEFAGNVTEIAGMADPYTGTYEIEIQLTEQQGKELVAGFIAIADIIPEKKEKLLAIPMDALFNESETVGYVYKVVDSSVIKQRVEFIYFADENVYVETNRIKPGDKVVTDGKNYITETSKITLE